MNGSVELASPYSLVGSTPMVVGTTIWDHFRAIDVPNPVVCVLNGQPILRRDWDRVVTVDDELQFVVLPLGGSFKKIISAVAMIALMVAAPYIAGPMAVAMGFAYGGTVAGLIGASIVIGGSMLINALLGPGSPNAPDAQDATVSPTYTLTAQGNSARLFQPIPRLYGRHMIYPDFAAEPWATYKGNDQYLYQLFCAGVGEYDIHEIGIEDTPIWTDTGGFTASFSDVEFEIIEPGDQVTLFPSTVQTSIAVGGQELMMIDQDIEVTISGNRISVSDPTLEIDGVSQSLAMLSVGDALIVSESTGNDGTYHVVGISGDGQWVDLDATLSNVTEILHLASVSWIGPFAAVESDRQTRTLLIDIVFPRGLFTSDEDGELLTHEVGLQIQRRTIDSAGAPLGDWVTIDTPTFEDRTATPIRRTLEYSVPLARYEVRIRRTTYSNLSTRTGGEVQWASLRAMIPDDSVFPDVTLVAVKMRATNQLTQQSSRKFRLVQTARIPTWSGSAWTAPQATRSIAWAAADLLRNQIYGAGLPDSRIDMGSLVALDAIWTTRGDTFDGVFDAEQTMWDALSNILRVGRAQPVLIAGVVNFIRDDEPQIVRGVFTPRNIEPGSFETTYVLYDEESPDAVIVEFMDERTWQQNEVLCIVPGSTESNPARIRLFGCVDRSQAWREGIYQAASNLYRRLFASLSTEMEGRMLIRGDLVAVSYDIPNWGQSSEVDSWDSDTRTIGLTEPASGDENTCALSDRKGKMWGPVDVEAVSEDGFYIVLSEASLASVESAQGEIPIYVGTDQEDTRVLLGSPQTYRKQFKVVTARPDGLERVRLGLTINDSRVYSADTGPVPAEVEGNPGSLIPFAPEVTGVVVRQARNSARDPVTLNVSWNPAAGATRYVVQSSQDGITWRTVYNGENTFATFDELAGTIYVRVAGVGRVRGEWAFPSPNPQTYGTPGTTPSRPSAVVLVTSYDGQDINLQWTEEPNANSYSVEIWEGGVRRGTFGTVSSSIFINPSSIVSMGGPWREIEVRVFALNGAKSSPPAILQLSDIAPPAPGNIITSSPSPNVIDVSWTGAGQNNLLVASEEFTDPAWTASGMSVTPNTHAAPNGEMVATTIADTGGSIQGILQTFTHFPGKLHVVSAHVKKDAISRTTRFGSMRIQYQGVTTLFYGIAFDTMTGEFLLYGGTGGSGHVGGVIDLGDFWRVWIGGVDVPNNTTGRIIIYPSYGASSAWAGGGVTTGSLIIWGAQAERASFPTDYLPQADRAEALENVMAYVLFASDTPGFTPDISNEMYRGQLNSVAFAGGGTGTTAYMRLRTEDTYAGGDGFHESAEFSQVAS